MGGSAITFSAGPRNDDKRVCFGKGAGEGEEIMCRELLMKLKHLGRGGSHISMNSLDNVLSC